MDSRGAISSAPAAVPGGGGRSPWLAFSVVAIGAFMATLDGNIVNVALPTIGHELSAPVGRLQWIVSGYQLAIAVTLLAFGRVGDLIGHRALYAIGLVVFTIGSALCGFAPSLGALIGARVLQALGASATMAIGPALITAVFPPNRRGSALGAVGTVVAIGLTTGPPLGGIIVAALSWRWVFFVNLPVGLAGAVWALRMLPRGGGPVKGPLVDGSIFRNPVFTYGLVAGFLSYAAMFSQTLLTPFMLARVLGLAPRELGLVLVSVPVALSVSSPLSGLLADRVGGRGLTVAGMALLSVALVSLSFAGAADSVMSVSARLALAGLGMGLFQSPTNAAVMSALPRPRLGLGGGLLATARTCGMAVGVGLAGALVALHPGANAAAGFTSGYALALRAGAVLALVAAIVSLAQPRGRPAS